MTTHSNQNGPLTQIHLTFSATNLPNADKFSKSDPFLVLYQQVSDYSWLRLGHSEIQHDNLNPFFKTTFPITFQVNKPHQFKVEIYDFDSGDCLDLSKSERLGAATFWLGTLLGSYDIKITTPLLTLTKKEIPNALLTIKGVEIANYSNLQARCIVGGIDYVKSSVFGKDETILQFIKVHQGSELIIYKSPIIFDTQSPMYPTFLLDLGALCDERFDQEFVVRVVYWKSDKEQKILGQNVLTLADLITTSLPSASPPQSDPQSLSPQQRRQVELMNYNQNNTPRLINLYKPKKYDIDHNGNPTENTIAKIKDNLNLNKIKGKLNIDLFQVSRYPTFQQYISNGLQFSLSFHVDFSDTNLPWENSSSPHWVDFSNKLDKNPYISTIEDVGGIIQRYCGGTGRMKPMYARGFGAKVAIEPIQPSEELNPEQSPNQQNQQNHQNNTSTTKTLSHSFPLSLSDQRPTATSIREIVQQYHASLPSIQFSHPLKLAPTIEFATKIETPSNGPVNPFTFSNSTNIATINNNNNNNQLPCYHVAVIITTNGQIDDMKETIQALYRAARTPISFIIVGVGDNNIGTTEQWEELRKLDGDDQRTPLQIAKNDYIDRDIFQFLVNDANQSSSDLLHLAHEVVAELPQQVVEYLWRNQFYPEGFDFAPVIGNL